MYLIFIASWLYVSTFLFSFNLHVSPMKWWYGIYFTHNETVFWWNSGHEVKLSDFRVRSELLAQQSPGKEVSTAPAREIGQNWNCEWRASSGGLCRNRWRLRAGWDPCVRVALRAELGRHCLSQGPGFGFRMSSTSQMPWAYLCAQRRNELFTSLGGC